MKLRDLLDVACSQVNVKYGTNYIENVSEHNPLIAKHVFIMDVKEIAAGQDYLDNFTLEVEIE